MEYRRGWMPAKLQAAEVLKIGTIAYLSLSLVILVLSVAFYLKNDFGLVESSNALLPPVTSWLPPVLWALNLLGFGLIFVLLKKCRHCQSGPAKRISVALDKMGKGDLGWKLILRQGDELAPLADSISHASQALADRVVRLQADTRELSEIENFLIDSIQGQYRPAPHTMKALRRLQICTSRLQSEMDDFQIPAAPNSSLSIANQPKSQLSQPAESAIR